MDRKNKRKKKTAKQQYRKWLIGGGGILCLFAFVFLGYLILQNLGKNSLNRHSEDVSSVGAVAELNEIYEEESSLYELKEGQILVDNQVYE